MAQVRYTVHYDIGTYEGDVVVWADEDAESDYVIAKAKRDLFRRSGGRPAGLYSERWRITETFEPDQNPKPRGRPKKRKLNPVAKTIPKKQRAAIERILEACDSELGPQGACAKWVLENQAWYRRSGTMHYQSPHLEALYEMAYGVAEPEDWKVVEKIDDDALRAYLTAVAAEPWELPNENPAKRRRGRTNEIIVYTRAHPAATPRPRAIRVDYFVDGVFAIHPSLRNIHEIELGRRKRPDSYGITHVPSGQLVATVRTKEWAKRLAEEIVKFAEPGYESTDPRVVQRALGGPNLERVAYIVYVSKQSRRPSKRRGKFPTYTAWQQKPRRARNPGDLKSEAAVAAAIGSLVGGFIGALGGAVVLGAGGALVGASVGGASGAATGAMVGAVYGVPLGAYIGTIWGAVQQTERALKGHPATEARILAGLGAGLAGPLAPVGAGVGAYIGAPE